MPCFEPCGCTCFTTDGEFDKFVANETRFDVNLQTLLSTHAGWYFEPAVGSVPRDVESLGLSQTTGVYVLWQQDGYCEVHDAEHLRAFYVGKSGRGMSSRLRRHQEIKQIGGELTTELSIWRAPNRQAKYVEQLLLDLYHLPYNVSESRGTRPLCHHIAPGAWN